MKIKRHTKPKTMMEDVEESLEKQGVVFFTDANVDKEYLDIPAHLDEQHPRDIGRYLHAVLQQRMWVRTLASRTKALLDEAIYIFEPIKARVFSQFATKMSVTEKEIKLHEDPEAKKHMDNIKKLQIQLNTLNANLENLEDAKFALSREVTLRGQDLDGERRGDNIGRKR